MNKFNSSIKVKTCKNPFCGHYPVISMAGYCSIGCMPEKMQGDARFKRKNVLERQKQNKANLASKLHKVGKVSETELSANHKAENDLKRELLVWFNDRMDKLQPKCESCGKMANFLKRPEYIRLWKSCQAHLLPKRHFKSLQTHPLNGMVLGSGLSGMCHCHDNYDASWDKAAKMPIWDEVVRRFLIMYPLIQPDEHQYIPDVLLQEINQI